MNRDKIFNLIGLAMRARKLTTGEELVINEVRKNKVRLVIVSSDASANTKKNITNKCHSYRVKCVEFGSRYELGYAIGKDERVIIGVMDAGFAKKLETMIRESNEERAYE
ncbi:YlxQ family RNA-binding protein [Macrococcus equipercicus]|uniref:YlxQ family RNA-binding protein n=1 Tax=Macrococcus equipercicus TaxID=69967 RepID=A0A9Q9F218_9STAP|nr:YlxQ family RNA-binding protein [Macrococcus equipercicus]KAA1036972.1 YlxQ family RNA-binding protein [Macrococcus equipercicus]UTH14683.1 YlxQ family RNA-binding protein [Macrococcus equipercicus]